MTCIAVWLTSCASPEDGEKPAPAARTVEIPEAVRAFLVERYFVGLDPHDPAIDASVELLRMPQAMIDHVAALPWEAGQLEKFGDSKRFYALVRTPGAKPHAIHFRGDVLRSDRELDEARVRILKRLYLGKGFLAAPAKELAAWMGKEAKPGEALARATRMASPALDAETLQRAIQNMEAPGTQSAELARALQALADSDPAPALCRAAVWVISRMDKMSFLRFKPDESGMDPETSICDLKVVEARAFYENVFYAVKAKNEFPWGAELSDHDFLNFVLSPRGTGEPLQRWRRLFYEAIFPEVRWLPRKDLDKAIKLALEASNDFYQYEGDTTWEDFGTLTGLATHEGRCEDCSNMETAFLRTVAIPGCQAFTPFWAAGDGNHAWTWIPAFGVECGEGRTAVKLFVKTWDALEDVTDKYVPVTTLTFEGTKDGEAELRVWNMEEWRRVARVPVKNGKAVFEKVGCPRDFALAVRLPGEKDRVFALAKNGTMSPLQDGPPGEGALEALIQEKPPASAALANPVRGIESWTVDGWKEVASKSVSEYEIGFKAEEGRLYRVKREKGAGRPFVVTRTADGGAAIEAR